MDAEDRTPWILPEYHKFLPHPSRRLVTPNAQATVDAAKLVHGTDCLNGLSGA